MGDALKKFFIDPSTLPEGPAGLVQVVFLAIVYGGVLFTASGMISDSSELLLLVPSLAGLVGSVVLPILGAVPDGAIVLFSGLGSDAQNQLDVGVGALAGSTIMLLTLPWAASIIGGRVDYRNGVFNYRRPARFTGEFKKLTKTTSLTGAGVASSPYVTKQSLVMLILAASYFIIQIPAFMSYGLKVSQQAQNENIWAGIGCVTCLSGFCWYLFREFKSAQVGAKNTLDYRQSERCIQAIEGKNLTLRGAMYHLCKLYQKSAMSTNFANEPFLEEVPSKSLSKMTSILKPFFSAFDKDKNDKLDKSEVRAILHELGENLSQESLDDLFHKADKDKSGFIDFNEFAALSVNYVLSQPNVRSKVGGINTADIENMANQEEKDEEEEEEDMPEDFATLSPDEQQYRLKLRAFQGMAFGTILVLLFADPIVDVFSTLGERTGLPSFYVSFILAPLASNASELIASYKYSLKKTQKTIDISFSALEGAASMNNTFCLGIFLAIVYLRQLIWTFNAETIAILFIEIAMTFVAQIKVQTGVVALLVLCLYPLSIALIAGLNMIF